MIAETGYRVATSYIHILLCVKCACYCLIVWAYSRSKLFWPAFAVPCFPIAVQPTQLQLIFPLEPHSTHFPCSSPSQNFVSQLMQCSHARCCRHAVIRAEPQNDQHLCLLSSLTHPQRFATELSIIYDYVRFFFYYKK